jgi:hypothetical protein
MTKTQADYYLHRCYRLLADPDTVLRHKRLKGNLHGLAFSVVQSMTVDFRKDALSTIIHECLHIIYPDWTEKCVIAAEKGIVDNMTQLQFQNLCYRIAHMGHG